MEKENIISKLMSRPSSEIGSDQIRIIHPLFQKGGFTAKVRSVTVEYNSWKMAYANIVKLFYNPIRHTITIVYKDQQDISYATFRYDKSNIELKFLSHKKDH